VFNHVYDARRTMQDAFDICPGLPRDDAHYRAELHALGLTANSAPKRAANWITRLHAYEHFWARSGRTPRENTRDRSALPASERRLGEWARYQRRFEFDLSQYQRARLDVSPAFDWDPWAANWERQLSACRDHLTRSGRLPLHDDGDVDEFRLARWLGRALKQMRSGRLPSDREDSLAALLDGVTTTSPRPCGRCLAPAHEIRRVIDEGGSNPHLRPGSRVGSCRTRRHRKWGDPSWPCSGCRVANSSCSRGPLRAPMRSATSGRTRWTTTVSSSLPSNSNSCSVGSGHPRGGTSSGCTRRPTKAAGDSPAGQRPGAWSSRSMVRTSSRRVTRVTPRGWTSERRRGDTARRSRSFTLSKRRRKCSSPGSQRVTSSTVLSFASRTPRLHATSSQDATLSDGPIAPTGEALKVRP